MMYGFNGFGFGGFGIGMLLFWGLIIAVIVMAVRGIGGSFGASGARRAEHSALDILRERYARGEIDKSEFERRREDLRGG